MLVSNVKNKPIKINIIWQIIPSAALHFNRLSEAPLKSVKFHLFPVIRKQKLTYEELDIDDPTVEIISQANNMLLCY